MCSGSFQPHPPPPPPAAAQTGTLKKTISSVMHGHKPQATVSELFLIYLLPIDMKIFSPMMMLYIEMIS